MITFFAYWLVTGLVLAQITLFLVVEYDRLAKYFNTHCDGDYPLNNEYSTKEAIQLYALGVLAGPLTLIAAHAAYKDWSSVE